MDPQQMSIVVLGMAFVLTLMFFIFRFARQEEVRKAGVKLELEREKTHRDIIAHVANGSITPDDAERLIRAMGVADEEAEHVSAEVHRAARAIPAV